MGKDIKVRRPINDQLFVLGNHTNINELTLNENSQSCHQYKILFIGSNPAFQAIKRKLQCKNISVVIVAEPTDIKVIENALYIDSLIVDFTHLEKTMELFKTHSLLKALFIPIIAYDEFGSDFSSRISYLHGVDDYVTKSIHMTELFIRINSQIERKNMLNSHVFLDELTQAYNRKYLNVLYLQYTYLKKDISFLLIDIDAFKEINDNYSYIVGDQVLNIFVNKLTQFIDERDVITRFGGDEFVIISPSKTVAQLRDIMLKAMTSFSHITFKFGNERFYATFSAGLLAVKPEKTSINEAVSRAQKLVIKSKRNGGNSLVTL